MQPVTRFFPFILTLALSFPSGCAVHRPKEFTIAIGGAAHELGLLEKMIREFEAAEGVPVRVIRQTTDTDARRQNLLIALQAKLPDPDLFLMDVAWVGQFAASRWLEPLDPYIRRDGFDTRIFFEGVLTEADYFEGRLIAFPVYIDAGLLYYRKDLLERYGFDGPPSTWDELLKISKEIQQKEREHNPGFYGFLWQGAQYEGLICNFLEFAASAGGGISIERGKIRLDFDENRRALGFMAGLIHEAAVSPLNTYTEMREEEVRRYFQRGDALFARNWPYAWSRFQGDDSAVKGRVGVHGLPSFEGGASAATLGGWHAGISKFSDFKEEAWKFLKFLLSYEAQKRFALDLGWNPSRRDIYEDPEVLEKLPHFLDLKYIFESTVARPPVPYYTQISEILQEKINAALSGEMTPEAALQQAENASQRIVGRYAG